MKLPKLVFLISRWWWLGSRDLSSTTIYLLKPKFPTLHGSCGVVGRGEQKASCSLGSFVARSAKYFHTVDL